MKSPHVIFEQTADGSHTLFVPELNEHYHSVNGAWQESRHVFIDAGLKQCEKQEIAVFEVGFGTGLNAFLALLEAERSDKIVRYTSLEKYPLPADTVSGLNYAGLIAPERAEYFKALHRVEWGKEIQISPNFFLHKMEDDLCTHAFLSTYDVIFFDAFAPDKQPEMWNPEWFAKLFDHTNAAGILTTYCAKGVVRRSLQAAGYVVERLQGPPGKREMLRGRKG